MSGDSFNIDRFLPSWSRRFGREDVDCNGIPFIRMNPSVYAEAFDSLIQTLIDNGYDRDMLEMRTAVKDKIYAILVPKHGRKKSNERKTENIDRAWDHCVDNRFSDPNDPRIKDGRRPEKAEGSEGRVTDAPTLRPEDGDGIPASTVMDENFDILAVDEKPNVGN